MRLLLTFLFMLTLSEAAVANEWNGIYSCKEDASVTILGNGFGRNKAMINDTSKFVLKISNSVVKVLDNKKFKGDYQILFAAHNLTAKLYGHSLVLSTLTRKDGTKFYSIQLEMEFTPLDSGINQWNIATGTCEKID